MIISFFKYINQFVEHILNSGGLHLLEMVQHMPTIIHM